jgi:hypothetical protein
MPSEVACSGKRLRRLFPTLSRSARASASFVFIGVVAGSEARPRLHADTSGRAAADASAANSSRRVRNLWSMGATTVIG